MLQDLNVLRLVPSKLQQVDDLRARHGLYLLVLCRAKVVELCPRVGVLCLRATRRACVR